jgi:hypothetical protein
MSSRAFTEHRASLSDAELAVVTFLDLREWFSLPRRERADLVDHGVDFDRFEWHRRYPEAGGFVMDALIAVAKEERRKEEARNR